MVKKSSRFLRFRVKKKDVLKVIKKVPGNYLYIFLDEGGDFNFSPNGTSYVTITSVTVTRPFGFYTFLSSLKYDLIEGGLGIEYFHASEDRQMVCDQVFQVIKKNLSSILIDSVVVEKRKTNPSLTDVAKFYPKMLGYLLKYICDVKNLKDYTGIVLITDAIPVKKRRRAVEKAIKTTLTPIMRSTGKPYRLLHHDSKSSFGLQIVDYCNWAIFRKWTRQDLRSYELVKDGIRNELDIFGVEKVSYY